MLNRMTLLLTSILGVMVGTLASAAPTDASALDLGDIPRVPGAPAEKPNILFIIMDDVGIDQLSAMGYGGVDAPVTPTIDAIADQGLRFRNTWAEPECSNGRMAMLTGRHPFRTQIYQAIGARDLANSHVSPYDVTVPRMLKQAGYRSALFGKYHLGGPENSQFGNGGPGQLGWDYFHGWIGGLPASIDTTAGGIGAEGTYQCGYVPSNERAIDGEGADFGACYFPSPKGDGPGRCQNLVGDILGDSPGLACLNIGGVLAPNQTCAQPAPESIDFARQNAHYVSPLVINRGKRVIEASLRDPRARNYRSSIEVNAAIRWIKSRQRHPSVPWMATVSFSADHTPLQTPPGHLLSPATRERLALELGADKGPGTNCANILVQRLISDAMIEAMDSEISRLLVSTGIAKRSNGELVYDPAKSNTLIVIIGDNGTYGNVVKLPFDSFRSKATAYQTGVWVPLIVAGPMVNAPGRDVDHLASAVDVFGLFGEVAGIDPHRAAAPRLIDSETLLPYLASPVAPGVRQFNFAQGGLNIQEGEGTNPPCVVASTDVLPGSCTQTPLSKSVCEDNLGVWWGPGASDPRATSIVGSEGVSACWEINEAIYANDPDNYESRKVDMSSFPQRYYAARDDKYKLIYSSWLDYEPENPGEPTGHELRELFEVNESTVSVLLKLDRPGAEIYALADGVETVNELDANPGAARSLADLTDYLAGLFASEQACPGDGNGDGVVDRKDIKGYWSTVRKWSGSSVFDFNYDGHTDSLDLDIIRANAGLACR